MFAFWFWFLSSECGNAQPTTLYILEACFSAGMQIFFKHVLNLIKPVMSKIFPVDDLDSFP